MVLNAYSADYGRMAGAQVNWVGKSGTNSFHGNLFHDYNDKIFNANDFFNNQAGIQEPRSDAHRLAARSAAPSARTSYSSSSTTRAFDMLCPIPAL